MGSLTDDWCAAANLAPRTYEVDLVQPCPTILALIAPCRFMAAAGTLSLHVAIGKESLVDLTVELLVLFLFEDSRLVEPEEEFLCGGMMKWKARARVNVEAQAKALKGCLVQLMVPINECLRCDTLPLGFNRDGNTVLI